MMRTMFVTAAIAAATLLATPEEGQAHYRYRGGYGVYSRPYYVGGYYHPRQNYYYQQPYGYYQQPYYGGYYQPYYQPYYNNYYGRYGSGGVVYYGGRRGSVYYRF